MKNIISKLIIIAALFGICSGAWAGGGKEKQNDLPGIYIGVIPAADCAGIAVVAILGAEGNYTITYQYIGKSAEVSTFTGTFTYDAAAKMITLDGKNLPPYYKVNKKGLTQLDKDGNEIKGNLADLYKLRKVRTP